MHWLFTEHLVQCRKTLYLFIDLQTFTDIRNTMEMSNAGYF